MLYFFIGKLVLAVILVTSLESRSVWAEEIAYRELSLKQALTNTEQNNTLLLQYPYQQAQAQAMAQQAEITPQPELALEAENIFGSGSYSSLDRAEYTLSLSQNIELGDKANKRLMLAQASGDYEQAEYVLTRLDVLAETSRRYYQLLQLQSMQQLLGERLKLEQQALATLKRRARAGVVTQADVAKMDLRQAQTQSAQQRLASQYALQQLRLASMWQAEADFDQVSGDLLQLPELPKREQLLNALQQSPAIFQQQALLRLSDAQVNYAESEASSNLNLGVGFKHFKASDDNALTLSFSVPLAFQNKNAGRIKAAKAQQQLSVLQQQQQRQQLTLQLLEYQMHIQHAAAAVQMINEALLPKAQKLSVSIQAGFKKGRYTVLQWIDAEAELFALQQQRLSFSHSIYLYLLEIERITGQAMSAPSALRETRSATNLHGEKS